MLRYPEIFKVGVAGGPVIDWGIMKSCTENATWIHRKAIRKVTNNAT